MATPEQQADETISKAVWHVIAVTILWVSLFFFGVVMERLGLVGAILPERYFAGATGGLRNDLAECNSNLGTVGLEREAAKRNEESLRTNVAKLEKRLKELESH